MFLMLEDLIIREIDKTRVDILTLALGISSTNTDHITAKWHIIAPSSTMGTLNFMSWNLV
jgi:hypothetical protein